MKIPKDLFDKEELEFLKKHGITLDFEKDYSEDDVADAEEELENLMLDKGFENGEPTRYCRICEKIFDKFQDTMD